MVTPTSTLVRNFAYLAQKLYIRCWYLVTGERCIAMNIPAGASAERWAMLEGIVQS